MDLAAEIAPCFDAAGLIFAGTNATKACAFQLLGRCRDANLRWGTLEGVLRDFLVAKGLEPHAVEVEIAAVRDAMEFWLE